MAQVKGFPMNGPSLILPKVLWFYVAKRRLYGKPVPPKDEVP